MNQFQNISPLDYRYRIADLEGFLTEEASIEYQIKVEVALVKILAKFKVCPETVFEEVRREAPKITAVEVYREDKKTKHTVRALVNCIQKRVSKKARPFIHLGATSSDIYDTANAMRLRDATYQVLLPDLLMLEKQFIVLARKERNTLQIGRTHGQHAVSITFGFAMAEYVSRLGHVITEIVRANKNLRGKLSGAVGAYNALNLAVINPERFEKKVLSELGLRPATHSTQVVEPEYVVNHTHALTTAFGVLANFVRDMRQLQRTEIAEIGEEFEKSQVGSSTMPHKRNPVTFEHVEGLWKELMPRMITLYLDQVSEHQRDLSNYSSGRFVFEVLHGLVAGARRICRVMEKFMVDRERMRANFEISQKMIMAEPLYILLALAGHPDAHEAVRRLTLMSERNNEDIVLLLSRDFELRQYFEKIPEGKRKILEKPELYVGKASQKTDKVCKYWEKKLRNLFIAR